MPSTQEKEAIAVADATKTGSPIAEIIGLHFHHAPGNERDVNGCTFVVRQGDQQFTLAVREGVNGDGSEPMPAVTYPTGGDQYVSLIEGRHELLDSAQQLIAEATPGILRLFADLKA